MADTPDRVGWYPSSNRPGLLRYWNGTAWEAWWEPYPVEPDSLDRAPEPERGTMRLGSTRQERTAWRDQEHRDRVRALQLRADDGEVGPASLPRVRGELIFWWGPEIDGLKRQGQLGEALELAWECMEAVEAQRPLPYGWAWHVAVIARKMKRFDLEVEVIERTMALDAFPTELARDEWQRRLRKARALAAKAR